MSDLEEINDIDGNLSAVQSISTKLLEVTRLAEKLDTTLCEAGAKTCVLESTDKKTTNPVLENRNKTPQVNENESIQLIQKRDRTIVEDSNVEEYVTTTECSITPVLWSRSESFLSSEYEDALISTTCQKAKNESIEKGELHPELKNQTMVQPNLRNYKIIIESPDKITTARQIVKEKERIIKEVMEMRTLRVLQETRSSVTSYNFFFNFLRTKNKNVDISDLNFNRKFMNDELLKTPLQINSVENTYINSNDCNEYCIKSSLDMVPMHLKDNRGYYKQKLLILLLDEC